MKLNRISRTFNSETRNKFPMHLQIFADGGDTGADGGNSGVGDGDDALVWPAALLPRLSFWLLIAF